MSYCIAFCSSLCFTAWKAKHFKPGTKPEELSSKPAFLLHAKLSNILVIYPCWVMIMCGFLKFYSSMALVSGSAGQLFGQHALIVFLVTSVTLVMKKMLHQ